MPPISLPGAEYCRAVGPDCNQNTGQQTHRPLVPFGEAVMFKIPKTRQRIGDFEDRFAKGVWLGMTVKSGENIVGTEDGVFRTAGIIRCAPDQRWSSDMSKRLARRAEACVEKRRHTHVREAQ